MLGVEEDCIVSITSDWASADLAQVLAAGRASVLVPASGGSGSAVAAAGTTAVASAGVAIATPVAELLIEEGADTEECVLCRREQENVGKPVDSCGAARGH